MIGLGTGSFNQERTEEVATKKTTTTTAAPDQPQRSEASERRRATSLSEGAPEGVVPRAGTPDASNETDEVVAVEDGETITPGASGAVDDDDVVDDDDAVPPQFEIVNSKTGHRTHATEHDFKVQFKREGYTLVD
jgi:hypothetical protein